MVRARGASLLVVDGADLLVVEAVGLGRGDDDRVRPLAEREEEVQGEGADGGRLLDPGHLAAIEGDEDAVDAVAARDEPGQGDGVLLDADLIARGAEGELEGARRGGLRESWRGRLATSGESATSTGDQGAAQRGPAGAGGGLLRRGLVEHGARALVVSPAASVAVTRRTFWPSRSVTGRFSRTMDLGWSRSSNRATSTAFRVTVTWVMPWPPVTLPTTRSRSVVTRAWSVGSSKITVRGTRPPRSLGSRATTSKFIAARSRLSAFTICRASGAYQVRKVIPPNPNSCWIAPVIRNALKVPAGTWTSW